MTILRTGRSRTLLAPLALVCALVAGCSGPPVYVPERVDVVTASTVSGTTVHMTLKSGETFDADASEFLDGVGWGSSFLLLRGSSPTPWAFQVFPSNLAYTDTGCYLASGIVIDARDLVDVRLTLGVVRSSAPEEIVLRLPKAAGFTNHYDPGLASKANGNLACVDARGEVTSTY